MQRSVAVQMSLILALVVLLNQPVTSAAQSSEAAACVEAHTQAQLLRRSAKLLSARDQLRSCAAALCPGVVRSDCVTWLDEVTAELPTVVFQAESDDGVVSEVSVTMNGALVATELTGREVEVDPGVHRFVFESPGRERIERQVLIHARQKGVTVAASWRTEPVPAAAPTDAPAPELLMHRPTPHVVYYLAGVGAAGTLGFALFGALGKSDESSLEESCAPFCSSAETDSVHTKYLVADISLGIGIASLVAAGVVYLLRPKVPVEEPSEETARLRWSIEGGRLPQGVFRF